jgi:hypothetical protein
LPSTYTCCWRLKVSMGSDGSHIHPCCWWWSLDVGQRLSLL